MHNYLEMKRNLFIFYISQPLSAAVLAAKIEAELVSKVGNPRQLALSGATKLL